MNTIKLYRHALSGHSHRVELFLSLLNLNYDLVDVDLASGAHKAPDFLALNRFGQVPVLESEDTLVSDSSAILVYLARRYDEHWFPVDAHSAGDVMQWLVFAAHEIRQGPNMMRRINVAGMPAKVAGRSNRSRYGQPRPTSARRGPRSLRPVARSSRARTDAGRGTDGTLFRTSSR